MSANIQGNLLVLMIASLADEIVEATGLMLESQRMMLESQQRLAATHQQMIKLIHTYSVTPDPVHSDGGPAGAGVIHFGDLPVAEIVRTGANSKTAADAPAAQDGGQDVTAAGVSMAPVAGVRNGLDARGAAEIGHSPKSEQAVTEAGSGEDAPAAAEPEPAIIIDKAASDEVLDLYAEHAFTNATLSARTGYTEREISWMLSAARGKLDPRVIKGDSVREERDAVPAPQDPPAAQKPPAKPQPTPKPKPKSVDLPKASPARAAAAVPQPEAKTVTPDEGDIGTVIAHVDYRTGTVSHDLKETHLAPSWLRVVDRLKDQRTYGAAKLAADGRFVSENVMLQRLPEALKVLAKVGLAIVHIPHVGFQLRRLAQ